MKVPFEDPLKMKPGLLPNSFSIDASEAEDPIGSR